MSVDKFGRSNIDRGIPSSSSSHLFSPYRHGFIFTEDGNIDVENLKLSNVKSPTNDNDVCNKRYVDGSLTSLNKELHTIIEMSSKNTIRELEHGDIKNIYLKIADVDNKITSFKEDISREVVNLRNEFLAKIEILVNDRTIIITDLSNKISKLTAAVQLNTLNLDMILNQHLSAKIMSVERSIKNIEKQHKQIDISLRKLMYEDR